MNLWTEYEGRTVADKYYLETLLRSEGRSAFFKTRGKTEKNAVIRLTEAHFDEEEMLKRWRQVGAVEQPNLVEIRGVGQTTLDGVALAYVLLEPSDASLTEVLQERPLTASEALQVAKALVSALSALHCNGLVHEHVEPANVLAVDETVKLRSDCVRPCVVDMEFSTAEDCAELRRKDIRDVGVLLLQCLTQGKEWRPTLALPAPFNQLIPGAMTGGWTLERMETALNPPARPLPTMPPTAAASTVRATQTGLQSNVVPGGAEEPRMTSLPDSAMQRTSVTVATQPSQRPGQRVTEPAVQFRARNDTGLLQQNRPLVPRWVMYTVAAVLVVFVGWLVFGRSTKPAAAKAPTAVATVAADAGGAKPAAAQPITPKVVVSGAAARTGWHVVAYTYNHENQAMAKVNQLRRKHASLEPQVFSPFGHAPYFVALGGAMSSAEAAATLHRAQQAGLPKDTFMRNY